MRIEARAAAIEERPAVCSLINLAYDAEPYGPSLAIPITDVGNSDLDPYDRAENTRVLLVDGRLVCCLHLWERAAWVHGKTVTFGIVTNVATHPAHRRKGYATRLMANADDYMRNRGWAYGLLMGRVRTYGGRMGWRMADDKRETLHAKYVAPTRQSAPGVAARVATDADVPFLSRLYDVSFKSAFGPLVRSQEFWRRWSLNCTWNGDFVIACRDGFPCGYFHMSPGESVDELCWSNGDGAAAATFEAAAAWAAGNGADAWSFWPVGCGNAGIDAFHAVFGPVPPTHCDPDGQPAPGPDATPYRQLNMPDGLGMMVKLLNPGPGILSRVADTEALLGAMARHSWVYLDGDGL